MKRRHAKAVVAVAALTLLATLGAGTASADTLPTIATDPASNVGVTTAKLSGKVNPNGTTGDGPTAWHIDYRPEGSTEWLQANGSTIEAPASEEANPVEVEAIFGFGGELQPGQTYEFRIVAQNGAGEAETPAPYPSFTMEAETAPVLATQAATEVSYTEATLHGTLDPEGGNSNPIGGPLPIYWQLEYRLEGAEGWSFANGGEIAATEPEGGGPIPAESSDPIPLEADLGFGTLKPGEKYEVRLFAYYLNFSREATSPEPPTTFFETLAVAAPAVTIDAPGAITATTAQLSGEVDPQGTDPAFDSAWRFEYATQADFSDARSTKGGIVEDAAEEVEADLSKLQPNKTYFVRLKVTNLGGTSTSSEPSFTTEAVPPSVDTLGAGHLSDTEAVIHGQINPHNTLTKYWFEWGSADCSANPCTAIPLSKDADAGSGNAFVHVKTELSGLKPQATYHFRLLAKSAVGETEGGDVSFTTAATPVSACPNSGPGVGTLPDCRAWEMVSPADKNGGDVLPKSDKTRAALDGGAVAFASLTGFGDVRGFGIGTEYLSQRDAVPGTSGWATHAITPPQEPMTKSGGSLIANEPRYEWEMSADLSKGVFRSWSPLTDDPDVANLFNFYLREDLRSPGAGSYQLVTGCPLCEQTGPFPPNLLNKLDAVKAWLVGASADFGHVVFESGVPLAEGGNFGSTNAYESDHGTVRLVSVLPSGAPAVGAVAGSGAQKSGVALYTTHPVSSDGSRIVFTVGERVGSLYQRIDHATTIPLNLSERAVPDSPQPALYWDSATDGSRVFFTSNEVLTDDASGGGETKLYMWAKQPTDEEQSVAVDASGGSFKLSFNEQSTGPIPFDASASTVQSALETLKGPGEFDQPVIGAGNVTVSGGPGSPGAATPYEITFEGNFSGANVAQLEADESGLSGGASTATVATTHPVHNLTYLSTDPGGPDLGSNVQGVIGSSDDGHYVYFAGSGRILPESPAAVNIYLWHDGAISYVGELARFNFDTLVLYDGWLFFRGAAKESRVTPDGRHLLFMSSSGLGLLSARGGSDYDHGENNARELYLYSAATDQLQCASCNPSGAPPTDGARDMFDPSLGAVQATTHLSHPLSNDGRYVFFSTAERLVPEDTNGTSDAYAYDSVAEAPRLLSSGRSAQPSYFMDASADGTDVFFATAQRLSGWDVDGSVDLYDARLGGGFPEPPPPPPSCQGDACQPAPLDLNDPTPASSSFKGPGDQGRKPPSRCAKGKRQVKRRGKTRCVKKQSKRDANPNRRAGR